MIAKIKSLLIEQAFYFGYQSATHEPKDFQQTPSILLS